VRNQNRSREYGDHQTGQLRVHERRKSKAEQAWRDDNRHDGDEPGEAQAP
jgi:hypothetical protein